MKRTVLAVLLVAALVVVAWLARDHVFRTERATRHAESERARPLPRPPADPPARDAPSFPDPVDLDHVDRNRDLHGVVVRQDDGAPIAGAELQVVRYPWQRASVLNYDGFYETAPGPGTRAGRSDGKGVFLLSGLRRDLFHTLVVLAPGHGRYLLDFDPRPHEAGTIDLGDVELPAPHAIAGRIVNEAGEPIPRMEVNVAGSNDDRGRLRGGEPSRLFLYGRTESRRTDDLGRFRVPDLSPGSYTLTVRRTGAPQVERKLALIEGKDLLDVEITLPEGWEFTVTVVDEKGVAVPGVFVSVTTGEPGLNGQTDAKGRVKFVVTSRVTRVSAYPFASGRNLVAANVEVKEDGDEFLLALKSAATITGSVLDENGQPLFQAWIAAKSDGKQVTSARGGETTVWWVVARGSLDHEFHHRGRIATYLRQCGSAAAP